MSSWLANLANSLGGDDDDDHETTNETHRRKEPKRQDDDDDHHHHKEEDEGFGGGGVKEDLSELTKTLTRQLWGVASFLAPPPTPTSSCPAPPPLPPPSRTISDWNRWESSENMESVSGAETSVPPNTGRISGIRNDFAEIGGRFKNEISRLSSHKAVSEISKIASTFLPFGSEGEVEDLIGTAVGVTKEVLTFARNISMHPETWLDFPLADDEDSDDFDMSDAQQEHALAVERFAPRLAALRIELCPGYMSEGCFWKIYFVLLHPRLNKHDAELLSNPQIVEARAMLTQDLQNRAKTQEFSGRGVSFSNESPKATQGEHYSSSNVPSENTPLKTFACHTSNITSATDTESEKHPIVSTELQIIDKSVVEEEPVAHKIRDAPISLPSKYLVQKYEDDDDWLEDESSEMTGAFTGTNILLGNEDDVSFSDLEDDDDKSAPASMKAVSNSSNLPMKNESPDWVQLNRNSTDSRGHLSVGTGHIGYAQPHPNDHDNKDHNDWLDVDEVDVI